MSEVDKVVNAWRRITSWLQDHAPESYSSLNPPATDEYFSSLNGRLGYEIPSEFEALLRMNNGSTAKNSTLPIEGGGTELIYDSSCRLFPEGEMFNDCREVGRQHAHYMYGAADIDDDDYWKRTWLPVATEIDSPYGYLLDASRRGEIHPLMRFEEYSCPALSLNCLSGLLVPIADYFEGEDVTGTYMEHKKYTLHDGQINWL